MSDFSLRRDYKFQEKYDSGKIRPKNFKTDTEMGIIQKNEANNSNSEPLNDEDLNIFSDQYNGVNKVLPDFERT